MAQLTFYPAVGANSPVDGRAYRGDGATIDEAFATIRAGNGSTGSATNASESFAYIGSSATSNQYLYIVRSFFLFDTSTIPDEATINSATFSLYGISKANGLGSPEIDLVAATMGADNAVVASDYQGNVNNTTIFASVTYANWNTAGYNDFTLNASGLAHISKTGLTRFCTRLNWDTDNSFGGVWAGSAESRFNGYYADQADTTNDPKLVVDYSLPAGSPMFFSSGGLAWG